LIADRAHRARLTEVFRSSATGGAKPWRRGESVQNVKSLIVAALEE
jgi:hypothetical protein